MQARDDMAGVYGIQHPLTAMYAVNAALALGASGRHKEALAVIDNAQPLLRQAMGTSAPNYSRIEHWRERIQQAQREGVSLVFASDFLT